MRQKNTKRFLAAALLAVAVMTAVPARAAEQYRAEVGKDSLLQKAVAWLVDAAGSWRASTRRPGLSKPRSMRTATRC